MIEKYNELEHSDIIPLAKENDESSLAERFYEVLAGREEICMYGEAFQNAKVLHILGDESSGHRLLSPFYGFFIEDLHQDLAIKRIIRDHLRYVDKIQCAAASIVSAIRARVQSRSNDPSGSFSSLHVRRSDFLKVYEFTEMDAETMVEDHLDDKIAQNTTIYIATDELDLNFFRPIMERYDVVHLGDFKYLLTNINPGYYGMVRGSGSLGKAPRWTYDVRLTVACFNRWSSW